jgi:hypothetical protein
MCLNEIYITVLIGKNISNRFPVQKGLKQGDALSPLSLNFSVEYTIRRVKKTRKNRN